MRPIRLLLALGIAIGWSIAVAGPAAAGTCAVAFNGIDAARIESLSSPLELTVADPLVFGGTDPAATSAARVELKIGPIVLASESTSYDTPSEAFTTEVDLIDVAPFGVGMLRVTGTTDGCAATVWVRVSGRFPLATLTGITAAAVTIGGITGQLGAVASRRRWSRTAAALGGLATGTGAAVLGQQFGQLGLSYVAVGIIVIVAAGVGLALATFVGRSRRARQRKRGGDTASATTGAGADLASRPDRQSGRSPGATPYWCYVLADVDVLDLEDHASVVGRLRPGIWYLARRETGPWLHISAGTGLEGWIPRDAAHRLG